MRRITVSTLEALPCPLCGDLLERGAGRQGLVWICQTCRGGAVTLPILRKFAPRPFVNALWQTALHRGRCSSLVCPACTQPFTEVASSATAQIRVCVRCYWVWLDCDALDSLATLTVPTVEIGPPPGSQRAASEGRRVALEGRRVAVEDRRTAGRSR